MIEAMEVTRSVLVDLHRRMVRIRRFEDAAAGLIDRAEIPGFVHLSSGAEAVAAGVCAALRLDDQIASTHRSLGHLVAKGGDLSRMMAELMGKATGYNQGKGGSVHLHAPERHSLGGNAIPGAGLPIAVGAAFANTYHGTDRVVVAFFGSAAANVGAVHEAINMTATLQVPAVFVCENDESSESMPRHASKVVDDLVDRAVGYGVPGVAVDGTDAVAVFEAASAAVAQARAGHGPALIEAKTHRLTEQIDETEGDQHAGAEWQPEDPIARMERRLSTLQLMSESDIEDIHRQVQSEVEQAVEFATASSFPEAPALLDHVYSRRSMTGAGAGAGVGGAE